MTHPDGPSTPPGWYPDPDGAPGLVRWWNGISWSDVATPAGPGVTVQQPPGYGPRPQGPVGPPPAPPSGGARTGLVVGLGVLGLVLVVLIGFLVSASGDQDAVADPSASSVPVPGPPPAAGPTFPSGTVRIIDEAAGISYPFLGDGWYEWDLGVQYEVSEISGQYFTTQEEVPEGGIFIAQCTSGPLTDAYGWGGPTTLQPVLHTVADSARVNYYPGPNERQVIRDEARTIDGHPAHLYEFNLSWQVPGYDASGERAAMLLVDVGRATPALLYISIPNTHAELYGVIDRVLDDVDVLE